MYEFAGKALKFRAGTPTTRMMVAGGETGPGTIVIIHGDVEMGVVMLMRGE